MVGLVANKTSKPAFFDLIHRKPPSLIIGPIGVGFNLLKRSKLTVWIELFAPSFERSPGLSNDLFARGRHVRRSDTSLIAFSIRSAQRSSMRNVSTILRQSHFVFRLERLAGGLAD